MYYTVITVTTKPGKRFQGIEHLKKFASWVKEKYTIPTEILGNMDGLIYQNHIVLRYENLAQMEEVTEKLLADPEYLDWFQKGTDLLGWIDARQAIFQVF